MLLPVHKPLHISGGQGLALRVQAIPKGEAVLSFSEDGELIGSGIAYWYPPGSEYPDFEGQFDNSDVEVTITYDGYNFIVNCPELELYDDPFFKE